MPNVSGVGISFGADRIYDVLQSLDKFPSDAVEGTKVLFANLGDKEVLSTIPIVKELRKAGVVAEIYTDFTKLKKQFDYADKKKIPFLAIVGEDEVAKGEISIKNLKTGDQQSVSKDELIRFLLNS